MVDGAAGVDVFSVSVYAWLKDCTDVDTQLSEFVVILASVARQNHRRPLPPIPRLALVSGERVAPNRSRRLATAAVGSRVVSRLRLVAAELWQGLASGFVAPGPTTCVKRTEQARDSTQCRCPFQRWLWAEVGSHRRLSRNVSRKQRSSSLGFFQE
jgi:hypothetical protein